ncbi:MAG: VPLPA-CTERM sorting domain-containing protein [Pseudomonadota bacterium]
MKLNKHAAALSFVLASGFGAGHAATLSGPETQGAIFGFDLNESDSKTEAPFALELDAFDGEGSGQVRADIGTIGVYADNGISASASFHESITAVSTGSTGILHFVFGLDGTFDGGGQIDIAASTSVDPSDAFYPNEPFEGDMRSSLFFQEDPAIATSFADNNVGSDEVFFQTSDSQSVNFSIAPSTDDGNKAVDTQLNVFLAFESGVEFGFFFEIAAFSDFGQTVDFFGTAELISATVLDPVTLQALDDGDFSVNGSGGGDLVALAAANAGGDPIPVPAAVWLMGVGLAVLGRKARRA